MFDANSTVCTSVHSASLDMYAPQEVEIFSACKITETHVFHSIDESTFAAPAATAATAAAAVGAASATPGGLPTPVVGGLYDRRLGSLDGREPCATCGCRSNCPGHPGHVQLALPTFQPALLSSLVKVLKFTCLYCGRLRIPAPVSSLLIKAFELLQLGRFEELQRVIEIAISSLRVAPANRSGQEGDCLSFSESQRAALLRAFRILDEAENATATAEEAGDANSDAIAGDQHRYYQSAAKKTEVCIRQAAGEPASADFAAFEKNFGPSTPTRNRRATATPAAGEAESQSEPHKRHVARLFLQKLEVSEAEDARLTRFHEDISQSAWQVTSWRHLRRLLWNRVFSTTVCPNCGRSCSATFHVAQRSVAVEMRWKWTGKPPLGKSSILLSSLQKPNSRQATGDGPADGSAAGDFQDDAKDLFNERCLTYGKGGQAIGKMQLYAFQLRPLMEKLFSHRVDRLLLQCLLPVAARVASSCFFISTLPIPASNFRPPAAGAAFQRGSGSSMPVLHPRTASLLDLLKINERVLLAVNVMKHPDPISALEDPARLMELFAGHPVDSVTKTESKQSLSAVLTVQEQQRVKEFVMMHTAGNATWLPAYSAQLQMKVNEIVDQTKAENAATAAPGIRQWLEKKEGAIRQKMMGKRVNFAARTVLAPDALIATNEIGIPLHFAMKLYIPEPVTPRNAHLLAAMVINGPFRHPGAVSMKDAAGNVFVLEYLSPAARQAKARQLLAATQPSSARGLSAGLRTGAGEGAESSFTVYRHVLDGDVVLMNRQPSLHRLSLMGHFVRISRGACKWYHVNDYLFRNGVQQKVVEKHSERQPPRTKVVKKEYAEAEKRGPRRETGGRASLIHYWKRFRSEPEGAESSVTQKSEATRKDTDTADGVTTEDVFRLNFVNCSSYNADFDGDEMNMHLPQDLMARTEAAYLLNADCHFLVPKDGGPMRGLIQDFCLAGCMLTARDTFFTADMFHTLVYAGLSCYIDSRENTVVLDRGCGQGSRLLASNISSKDSRGDSVVAFGDPYRRRLLSGNSSAGKAETGGGPKLVIVPPAVVWPQKLWTGKQVITCVLKTLVDGIAAKRFAQLENTVNRGSGSKGAADKRCRTSLSTGVYRGINLTGKAKTPGDAWGGAEDGDTEEERVVIQESELLQGVFDKAQFGSNAGGLLHCVFILLGSAAAGLLLQSLAALFCAFLKLRGATASPGDFVMRRKGEFGRKRLAERIIQAGTYLQEHFTARLNHLMGWTEKDESTGSLGGTEETRVATNSATCQPDISAEGDAQFHHRADEAHLVRTLWRKNADCKDAQSKCVALLQMVSNATNTPVEKFKRDMTKSSLPPKGVLAPEVHLERLRLARLADAVCRLVKIRGQLDDRGKATKGVAAAKHLSSEHDTTASRPLLCKESENEAEQRSCEKSQAVAMCLSSWILTRLQRLPLMASGKLITAASVAVQLKKFVSMLKTMSEREDETVRAWLARLQESSPIRTHQLLRLAQALQGRRTTRHHTEAYAAVTSTHVPPEFSYGQLLPVPSTLVCLPNGGFIQGDPSLLQIRLYHPSWLWSGGASRAVDVAASQLFEKTDRYILQAAARVSVTSGNDGIRTFSIPSRLTQRRIGSLYKSHFLGRKEMFNEMFDAFFQSAIGKVASSSTDIMDGSSFLYRFPQNGFAGMIKSGSKGSNINFAMISVFLGQQSLEGRRVKNMPSDRSLPSFCQYDFGSRARGFITSSFLSGLKEEEYFFHCMAGREGLVDTAVKTAKSGYLQRSVIKGMEALTVRYDGSVRDADDSIIQFVYGDDGRDPMHRSTFEKITCLLENPDLLRCVSPLSPDIAVGNAAERKDVYEAKDEKQDDVEGVECPVSPFSQIGITCPKFECDSVELVSKVLKERQRVRSFLSNSALRQAPRKTKVNTAKHEQNYSRSISGSAESYSNHGLEAESEEESTRAELYMLLKLLYHKCLAPPGEAVGCVAAQSIGEPATQMTLNTFHLAGHGAANVTMGIPRLRELLQQGGATKTPIIYVPLRSVANVADGDGRVLAGELSKSAVLAQNASTALRGFTTINLASCVHSLGVDTKVCYQSPHCLDGCPAFHLPPYTKSTAASSTTPFSRLYWQYDVCIQLENLSHFVQVVPTYSQAELCVVMLKKVIRTFLKKVSRLMVASVAHYGRAGCSTARNDIQNFFQQRVCQDNRLNRWHYRAKIKEILRTARVAASTAQVGEATAADSFVGGSVSHGEAEVKEGAEGDQEEQHRSARDDDVDGEKNDSAGEEDEEEERTEAEEEEESSEDGSIRSPEGDEAEGVEGLWTGAQEKKNGRRKDKKQLGSHNSAERRIVNAEDPDIESSYTDSGAESRLSAESSSESDAEDDRAVEITVEGQVTSQRTGSFSDSNSRAFASNSIRFSKRCPLFLSFAEILRGKEFNLRTHLFESHYKTDDKGVTASSTDTALKGDALWENGRRHRGAVLISREVAAILHGISVCPRTWRMVVKFGWPMEKCPYRLEVLPMLRNLLQKSYIQRPEGVTAPRIVQGEGCALGQESELQCEGSNIQWIHEMKEEAIDHKAIRTNDVRAMLKHYGVEAARICLVKELEKVFSAYGIKVDYRHLALVADFMTHDGEIRPFNRSGMAASNAPFLQMSYETSFKFLTEACERAATDSLTTPSGGLMVGTPATVGSGQCDIFTRLSSVAGCCL